MINDNRTPHVLFVTAGLYWLLPGHFQISPNATGPVDLIAVLMLSLAWLVCYANNRKTQEHSPAQSSRRFPLVFLVLAAATTIIYLFTPIQGLKGSYYANNKFQPPMESSWLFNTADFTRIDPKIDFVTAGFSFTKQYFPLYFSNDAFKRQWQPDVDVSTDGYLFSAEWTANIYIPKDVTELAVRSTAGRASMSIDGVDYADRSATSLSNGQHDIRVRYARENKEPPSLSLQWVESNKWNAVPAHAFAANLYAKTIPCLQLGIFLLWLATLGYLAWKERPLNFRNYRTVLWLVFLILVVKSALRLTNDGKEFNFQILSAGNDWLVYETFARDILHGNWLSTQEMPFIAMNFAYRYILALLHLLGGEAPASVLLLQLTSMALFITVAAGAIAKRWGIETSLIFLAIVLITKQMVEFAGQLLDTTWGVVVGMICLYGLIEYARNMRRSWLVISGISLGVGILIRANFLPFVGVAMFWIWISNSQRHWQKKMADMLIFVALVTTLISLLGLRNYLVAGEWRWMPTTGLPNLWIGNHPPEFDGPTYFSVKWAPEQHEILQHVIRYIFNDPLALLNRISDKSFYIFGVDLRHGLEVDKSVLLPWLCAAFSSLYLWVRPHRLQRRELVLLWLWVGVVNLPLATLFFPWGYGWRLSGPSFLPLYLLCAVALSEWRIAGKAMLKMKL